MKKVILLLFSIFAFTIVSAQKTGEKFLPFVLLIDNEIPEPSVTEGIFLIKDSVGTLKDSVMFDYRPGVLSITTADYKRLFKVKPVYNIFLRISHKGPHLDTTYVYLRQIDNKYWNWEYPHGYMNEYYFIFKVFNKFNPDSRNKYYFKPGQDYITQITIGGMSDVIPVLKKE
ncbi:MAG: hypothetical protein ACHQHN_11280 [Sphingobacteriales bacterium]